MATKSKRHIHKYYRALMNGDMLWTCALPDCMHHMPKHYEQGVFGKGFYCWDCGEMSQLRKEHLALEPKFFLKDDDQPIRPICYECANKYVSQTIKFEDIDETIKAVVGEK